MLWTKELVITLIELFRERPVLWDRNITEYKDKDKKHDAWIEIGEEMKINKADVQTKMKNITTQFNKELKKAKSGSGANSQSKWFAFDHLQFMKDMTTPRRSRESGAIKKEQTGNNIPSMELGEEKSPSSAQTNEPTAFRDNIPSMELAQEIPSSAQHQFQLIQYQLDQQCQQTELALHQMETECAARRKAQHQLQLIKYQLDQQCQQTQLALQQVQFVSDQKETECTARGKAQETNNQLMNLNKELMNHIENLFQQNEDLEKKIQFLEHDMRSKIPHQEPQALRPRFAAIHIESVGAAPSTNELAAIRIESVGTAPSTNEPIEIKVEDD